MFAKTVVACIALALASEAATCGPRPYPPVDHEAAWPGTGPIRVFKWMSANRETFWQRRDTDQGAIVFAGDSLTAGWRTMSDDLPGLKVANRGIGGDTSRGLLFRCGEDVLDLHPRAIVICIGTNDLSAHANPKGIVSNISELIRLAHERDESRPIFICTVPPRDAPDYPTQTGAHAELNRLIEALAEKEQNVTACDLFAALAKGDGKPDLQYFGPDHLHLAEPGYRRWAGLIRPLLEKIELH